jgi:hypothetical protein
LRRPPVRCFTASSGLCGRLVVISSFTSDVLNRSVGVIGLYVLIGIVFARNFYYWLLMQFSSDGTP